MTKPYSYSGKGEITSSNPHFINFGKKRKFGNRIVGEVQRRIEKNSLGNPEHKIIIQFTARDENAQQKILKALRKGKW